MVLKFLLTDNRFQWNILSTCSSVAKTTSPTINALSVSQLIYLGLKLLFMWLRRNEQHFHCEPYASCTQSSDHL